MPLENQGKHWNRILKGVFRVNPLKRWNLHKITEFLKKCRFGGEVSDETVSEEEIKVKKAPSEPRIR